MIWRKLIRMLERDGWRQVSQRGSHRKFRHPTKKGSVVVSPHQLGDEVRPGLEGAILRSAGLKK